MRADLANSSANTIKHVITHEPGHSVGLHRSDCDDRSISCSGSPVNEGTRIEHKTEPAGSMGYDSAGTSWARGHAHWG
ncbi:MULTISPECIES: M57 family metalloprotease [Myxococcus]|uniref:M57 family metalloprotease n=1 Tax=Myxococcus TaxID=32 RepID=UPI0013D7EF96|nr:MULTISPECIES: M57 family metalloprotease [Myxococcus]NVJ21994.1 hypothetical protein [Myxococcus sp. AM011]